MVVRDGRHLGGAGRAGQVEGAVGLQLQDGVGRLSGWGVCLGLVGTGFGAAVDEGGGDGDDGGVGGGEGEEGLDVVHGVVGGGQNGSRSRDGGDLGVLKFFQFGLPLPCVTRKQTRKEAEKY